MVSANSSLTRVRRVECADQGSKTTLVFVLVACIHHKNYQMRLDLGLNRLTTESIERAN